MELGREFEFYFVLFPVWQAYILLDVVVINYMKFLSYKAKRDVVFIDYKL